MTPTVTSVDMETPLTEASKLLTDLGIRHLPILDEHKLVGVVSKREIALLQACQTIDLKMLSIADAMTELPFTVGPDTPVADVCATMAAEKYGSAVVVENGSIQGIFTTTDALQILSEVFRTLPV